MPKILVVDDESNIVELIKFNLVKERWAVEVAFDGSTAIKMAQEILPDVIILDVMLPEFDGLEVCRRLKTRNETEDIQIIMLSAKAEELDRIIGLEMGADDYITKPFNPRELVARVKARLRKKTCVKIEETPGIIQVEHVVIDPEKYEIYVNGEKGTFTFKEFELLKLLALNRGRIHTREMLLNTIWGYNYSDDTRTVDVHIRHLRMKIEKDPNDPELIETIRGIGYRFKD